MWSPSVAASAKKRARDEFRSPVSLSGLFARQKLTTPERRTPPFLRCRRQSRPHPPNTDHLALASTSVPHPVAQPVLVAIASVVLVRRCASCPTPGGRVSPRSPPWLHWRRRSSTTLSICSHTQSQPHTRRIYPPPSTRTHRLRRHLGLCGVGGMSSTSCRTTTSRAHGRSASRPSSPSPSPERKRREVYIVSTNAVCQSRRPAIVHSRACSPETDRRRRPR